MPETITYIMSSAQRDVFLVTEAVLNPFEIIIVLPKVPPPTRGIVLETLLLTGGGGGGRGGKGVVHKVALERLNRTQQKRLWSGEYKRENNLT